MKMNIVMPVVGRASRFREYGYTNPKPLIEIKGKPMVKWATDSLPFITPEQMIFVVLKDHIDEFQIDEKLRSLYSDKIRIVVANSVTEGAACSVLLAKKYIDNDDGLIVYNTDQYFKSPVGNAISNKNQDIAGLIPVFQSNNPRWSFVKVDREGFALETAEKVPISSHATVGLYYFLRGSDFVWAAEQMIKKNIRRNNEFYVCPVYNELIRKGMKIKIVESDFMWSFGMPEDIEHFNAFYTER